MDHVKGDKVVWIIVLLLMLLSHLLNVYVLLLMLY